MVTCVISYCILKKNIQHYLTPWGNCYFFVFFFFHSFHCMKGRLKEFFFLFCFCGSITTADQISLQYVHKEVNKKIATYRQAWRNCKGYFNTTKPLKP